MAGPKSVVEKKGQLVFCRQHERVSFTALTMMNITDLLDRGGHFAAMERPKEFLVVMEDFRQVVMTGLSS